MISAQQAMEQAAITANLYARNGREMYHKLFGPVTDPVAEATFVAAYMRAAAQDFHSWVIHNAVETVGAAIVSKLEREADE